MLTGVFHSTSPYALAKLPWQWIDKVVMVMMLLECQVAMAMD